MDPQPTLIDFSFMMVMAVVFGSLAVGLWLATGVIFYLYNFSIIGLSLVLGMGQIPELWWFLGGNAIYSVAGIALASHSGTTGLSTSISVPLCRSSSSQPGQRSSKSAGPWRFGQKGAPRWCFAFRCR